MAELMGRGYVMDFCMASFLDKRKRQAEEKITAYYYADCLRLLTENTAKMVMGGASCIKNRLSDIMDGTTKKQTEMTGDEIAAEIIAKAGLSGGVGDEPESV